MCINKIKFHKIYKMVFKKVLLSKVVKKKASKPRKKKPAKKKVRKNTKNSKILKNLIKRVKKWKRL